MAVACKLDASVQPKQRQRNMHLVPQRETNNDAAPNDVKAILNSVIFYGAPDNISLKYFTKCPIESSRGLCVKKHLALTRIIIYNLDRAMKFVFSRLHTCLKHNTGTDSLIPFSENNLVSL